MGVCCEPSSSALASGVHNGAVLMSFPNLERQMEQ